MKYITAPLTAICLLTAGCQRYVFSDIHHKDATWSDGEYKGYIIAMQEDSRDVRDILTGKNYWQPDSLLMFNGWVIDAAGKYYQLPRGRKIKDGWYEIGWGDLTPVSETDLQSYRSANDSVKRQWKADLEESIREHQIEEEYLHRSK